jgi:hypothetical protein
MAPLTDISRVSPRMRISIPRERTSVEILDHLVRYTRILKQSNRCFRHGEAFGKVRVKPESLGSPSCYKAREGPEAFRSCPCR